MHYATPIPGHTTAGPGDGAAALVDGHGGPAAWQCSADKRTEGNTTVQNAVLA